jgi:glycosyltransferase involved in cell wall biosynthesis
LKTPKASFVIPCFNGQAFLAETIQSCLDQTQPRFEVIVVDDGSTDGTQDLLTHFQYLDDRVRVIRLPERGGRSNARNVGIEAAQSEIILTLDADDISFKDRVEKTLKYFKKNPSVDIVYSDCHNIDAWGELIVFQDQNGQQTDTFPAMPFDFERLKKTLTTYIPCHSSMSFQKKVYGQVKYEGGAFSEHGIDDWKFQVDCYRAGFKFGQINRVLVQYRYIPKTRDEEAIKKLKEAVLAQ